MTRASKNQAGFFSIHFIFFVSLISYALISYGYVFYAQKQKDLFRKICYYDMAQIQRHLVQQEKQLFLLNPISTALRLKLKILYAELILAMASQNSPLIVKITLDINNTLSSQKKLDSVQKSLIQAAQIYLKTQLTKIQTQISQQDFSEKQNWNNIIPAHKYYVLKQNVTWAVQPDSIGGIGPNYELSLGYEQQQELTLNLQHNFSEQSFSFFCAVSFNKKESQWTLKINQDRPL